MKGLLIKDINIMLGNVRAILPTIGIGVVYVFFTDTHISFGLSFMIMLFSMLALSTLAYDEENEGLTYLMTLPVSRYQYVLSKYLFLLLFMGVGFVASMATFFISAVVKGVMDHTGSLGALRDIGFLQKEEWISCLITLLALYLLNIVLLPMRYKFGETMQRIVVFIIVAFGIFLGTALGRLTDTAGIDPEQWLTGIGTAALALIAAGLCVTAFLVSLGVSAHVIAKKEF